HLNYEFMQKALIAAIFIGVICALIGTFVLLRGLVFLGEAIAHSAFAGAALAILLGMDPLLVIMAFSVLSSISIGYVNEKKLMKDEIIIGVIFSFFMALAILFISLMPTYSTDVNSILFGNILIITPETFWLLIIFSLIIIAVIFGIKKELYFMTFDEESAKVSAIPVRAINYLFLILVSMTISVSLRAIGAILVFAMIITPAAAAYQWTFKLNKMLFLSALFGVISAFLGLFFSYIWDLPSGSTIVGVATIIFAFSFIVSPKRRKSGAGHDIENCEYCSKSINGRQFCLEESCVAKEIPHKHSEGELIIYKKDLKEKRTLSLHKHEMEGEE
ncbi:MAG: metal ABC transporter permease, partial [Candidatus Heimdallarchaeota archaeon]|nr:metal ABC transporter permease [Candidatus Heimdallarchaeota archaeon]